ncbi:hypothetical protein BDV18DRAFT_139669 [Aspergillus unguis]
MAPHLRQRNIMAVFFNSGGAAALSFRYVLFMTVEAFGSVSPCASRAFDKSPQIGSA